MKIGLSLKLEPPHAILACETLCTTFRSPSFTLRDSNQESGPSQHEKRNTGGPRYSRVVTSQKYPANTKTIDNE